MDRIKYIILILIPIFVLLVVIYICISNYTNIEYKKSDASVGKYENVEILEEEVANKYLNQILEMLESKNFEAITSQIDRDNPKYSALSTLAVKEELERIGIIGKKLEKQEYSTNYVEGLNNSFSYILLDSETNNTYEVKIKEYSPNIFTFSF